MSDWMAGAVLCVHVCRRIWGFAFAYILLVCAPLSVVGVRKMISLSFSLSPFFLLPAADFERVEGDSYFALKSIEHSRFLLSLSRFLADLFPGGPPPGPGGRGLNNG